MKSIAALGLTALAMMGLSAHAAVSEKEVVVAPEPPQAVKEFHFFGRLDGWRSVDRDTLIVWANPFRPYLIELSRPAFGLRFANAIGITSTHGTVHAKFDSVQVDGLRYPIKSIYRLSRDQAKSWGRSEG